MSDNKEIVAVGSIAFDSIETPKGKRDRILGGSATYFGIAASVFSKVHFYFLCFDLFLWVYLAGDL